mgnify:CR=1 FL=1
MVHTSFSCVNRPFQVARETAADMNDVWDRFIAAAERIQPAAGRPEAWLADKLGTTVQTVHNWKARGVPPSRFPAVAKALGMTVEQLLGQPAAAPTAWPFEEFVPWARMQRLTPAQIAAVGRAVRLAVIEEENAAAEVATWKRQGAR